MITTIPARELHTALTGLAKVTPRKASLPILQGVLIEAAGTTVRLTSTDLDSTVSYTVVNAAVTEPGLGSLLEKSREPRCERFPRRRRRATRTYPGRSVRRRPTNSAGESAATLRAGRLASVGRCCASLTMRLGIAAVGAPCPPAQS
jgi:hypothetical protein